MNTAVSITLQTETGPCKIDFLSDEVRSLSCEEKQSFVLKRLQNRRPFILRTGKSYYCYNLLVRIIRRETLEKLAVLNGNRETMMMEYRNIDGELISINVRLIKEVPSHYSGGFAAAKRDVVLDFVEQ